MSIPYNTYNGTKCLLLPDDMKSCKLMAKTDNPDKQKYVFPSKNNYINKKNSMNLYCCNTQNCNCIEKDNYYYSKITSIVILDNNDRSNVYKKGSFSQQLNGHYVVSQGINGNTANEKKVDKTNINMSGNIGNIYKKDKAYLYNNQNNIEIEELKKKELEKEFSWRIYNINGNGLQCYENAKKEDFTRRKLRGKNSKGRTAEKNWVDDYNKRRSYVENDIKESLPQSLRTIPKMIKWTEVQKTGDGVVEIDKYPIFRFIIDTNITTLNIDGFEKHTEINGDYILTAPLYPYMDGTPGPVFKNGDLYLWYIPFMDKTIHVREWNTSIKKFEGDVFSCYCIQKIEMIDGIPTLKKNYCFSNNTGINGNKGEFMPRGGVWTETLFEKSQRKNTLCDVSILYGKNQIETFVNSDYETIGKNKEISNYDSYKLYNNKNNYEHFDGVYLDSNINTIENFKADKVTEKLKIGETCQKNTDCITGLCDIEGEYGCENKCLRDKNTINKAKPAAYNCPKNFLELDNYYSKVVNNSNKEMDKEKNKMEKEINQLETSYDTLKKNYSKTIDMDINSKRKDLDKIYEPDDSINLKNTKKSLVQNYVDTLVDFGKQQNGTIDVDNSTMNIDDDMIEITERSMDRNSDELIKIQNEIDTVKRQSSIGFDSILKRTNLEDFFKMLVIYLLIIALVIFLKNRSLLSNNFKKYCVFSITVIFVGIVIFKFSGIKFRSGYNFATKEFSSNKNLKKMKPYNPNLDPEVNPDLIDKDDEVGEPEEKQVKKEKEKEMDKVDFSIKEN